MVRRNVEYFAAVTEPQEFARRLAETLRRSQQSSLYTAHIERARQAYRYTYGEDTGFGSTSYVSRNGHQGELANVRVNNAPALARAQHALVTAAKVVWRPVAANTDVSAQSANILSMALLEYYWKHQGLQWHVSRWTMQAIRYAESFSFVCWDMSKGPEVGVSMDGRRIEREGDISFHVVPTWDVLRDPDATSWESCDWVAVRLWKNRYDVAALATPMDGDRPMDVQGKDASSEILGASRYSDAVERSPLIWREDADGDICPVWYFFHKNTPAVPAGRESVLVGGRVLSDGPLEYPELPVVRMAPDERDGTSFGNTSFHDVLGIQELRDGLHSSIASNQLALAVQSIAIQDGTKFSIDDVTGLRAAYYPVNGKPPVPLQMTASPAEIFGYVNSLKAEQQQIMGLNDTALGQPQEKLSGSAYALLYSAASQQNSGLQGAMVAAVSKLGTVVIKTLRAFVSTERSVLITGKSTLQQYRRTNFVGADLDGVDEVLVEIGNPLEQTVPGKMELLNTYRQVGAITEADHVVQVVETGRIEPATQGKRNEMQLLAYEREELAAGRNPIVHTYQNHLLHAKEHKATLDDPEALKNPAIVQAVQDHQDWHYREFYGWPEGIPVQQDPLFLPRMRALNGYAPVTPDLMMMPQPPGPPGGTGEGEGGPPESMQLPAGTAPAGPNGAQAPNFPTNPVTGSQVNPEGMSPAQAAGQA